MIIPEIKEPVSRAFSIWKDDISNKYLEFKGRATRAEFWQFMAIECAITFALGITIIGPAIFILATLLPSLAVASRRLHDCGRTAKLILIPLILWILGMIFSGIAYGSLSYTAMGLGNLLLVAGSVCGILLYYLLALPTSQDNTVYGPLPSPVPGRFKFELKEAFIDGIKHYFDFNSKMLRHEFWFFMAGITLLLDLLAVLSSLPVLGGLFELVTTLAWLFFIIPVISAVVRRLRDIGIRPLFALFLPVLVLVMIAIVFAAISLTFAFGIPGFILGFLLVLVVWYGGLGYFAAVLAMKQNSAPKLGGYLK